MRKNTVMKIRIISREISKHIQNTLLDAAYQSQPSLQAKRQVQIYRLLYQ